MIRERLKDDPLSGDVFAFFNRGKNKVDLLVWDRNGFRNWPLLVAWQPIADYTIDPLTDQAVWKKEYISGFGQVLAERSIGRSPPIR